MKKYSEWSWKGLATSFAVFWGVYMAVAAWFASAGIVTVWFSPETFRFLMAIYPGLTPAASGIFVGLAYGLLCGAVCGAILAWLYNWGAKLWN